MLNSGFPSIDFETLPERLDDAQLGMLEKIAAAALPGIAAADERFIAGCLRAMTVMPRSKDDETSGKVRLKMYTRHLTGYSAPALQYLVDEAIRRHEFFPSIHECLAILKEWPNRDHAAVQKTRATARASREHNARMDDAIRALRDGEVSEEAFAQWPERWQRIAETQGHARRNDDGTYSPRPDPAWVEFRREQQGRDA